VKVALDLPGPDDLRLLQRALENYQHLNQAIATRDGLRAEAWDAELGERNKAALVRRVGIYTARAARLGELLAQLPSTAPLVAPLDT
jgi:hypothetical protein